MSKELVENAVATYTQTGQFTVGQWTVTPALDRLERGDKTVTIEPSAMAVLVYLARHANQVVAAEELTKNLWRKKIVGDDAVYQRIHRLRAVFEDDRHHTRYIETIPKKGYRLLAAVEFSDGSIANVRFSKRQVTVASVLVLVAAFLGIFYLLSQQSRDAVSPLLTTTQVTEPKSIAVLPFIDLSDGQDQKYLGDGIAEELIHTLSNIVGLRVAARTSTFRIAQTDADIRTIGQKLNVTQVLEGSVRKHGDQVRITAQLVNVADGYHLWSKTFDRDATDLIKIQQEIAVAVAESFATTLTLDTAYGDNQALITDVDSYGYYLLGRHHLRAASTPDLDQAVTYFRRAIELNPDISRAYSGLASAYLLRPRWGDRNEDQILRIAKTAIEQALAIDAQDAEAYAALGMLRERNGDNAGAIAAFEQAIELKPNYAMAYYWYSGVLESEGRRQETLVALEMAAKLEPFSGKMLSELGIYYSNAGHIETAMEYWLKAIDADPTNVQSYGGIVDHLYFSGQLAQFVLVLNQYLEIAGDETLWGTYLPLMWAYRAMYDLDTADFWLDRLLDADVPKSLIPHERALASMAHNNFDEVGTILHSWVSDVLDDQQQLNMIAWYEMIIGHDNHARRLYDRVAGLMANTDEVENASGFDISFGGHYPEVNRAHLMMRANESTVPEDMLTRSREYIADRLSENSHYPAGNLHVLAAIDAVEGNRIKALEGLRKAIDAGWTRVWFTELDPNFASLRNDPEFQQIMAETKVRLEGMREQIHRAVGANPSKLFSSMDQ